MKQAKRLLMVLLLAVSLAACVGQQGKTMEEQAGHALLVGKDVIVSIAVSADQLCTAGVLNQAQCDEVSNLYETAKVTYDLAESSLATALQTDSEDSWARYEAFHNNFQQLYTDLLVLAARYGIEHKEVK